MRSRKNIEFEEILSDKSVEGSIREVPIRERKFFILIAVVAIIVGAMIVELVWLNIGKQELYTERALDNVSDSKVKHSPRGIIYDRFAKAMTENAPAFNVYLIPQKLPVDRVQRQQAIKRIADILRMSEWEIVKKIEEKDWSISGKMLLADEISQNQLVELSSSEYLGISIEESFQRIHSVPYAFSEFIGYTGLVNKEDILNNSDLTIDDRIGRSGLEMYYDQFLRGVNGKDVVYKTAKGEIKDERLEREPKPGKNITTYIDSDFQKFFYESLKKQLEVLGRDVGVGIAIDPRNGEVLALTSVPGFDSQKIGSAIIDSRRPLFSRSVAGVYNPGSTIKPLVATAALTEGTITPVSSFFSSGMLEIPNPYTPSLPSKFPDNKAHGWVNARSALARSSNIFFYIVGGGYQNQKGLGIYKLKEWWTAFGLAEKTGIDIPGEKIGFLPDPEWKEKETGDPWRLGDTYHVSIGQGDFSITPIELLNYICAIANGGMLYKPRIVDQITNSEGNELLKTRPSVIRDLKAKISPDALHEVQEGMKDVVDMQYGTAYLLHDIPMNIAAKSGTAQIQNNAKTNAFFVGYAPAEDPKIAILILVENSREGSLNATPVARDVLLWYYNNRLKGL
ncbi:MAG: penicillin-binding transpeptidase domain-containing protein [Candidatus Paceibacterota bacterium]|jgi:penicillin-binding protein 2